MKIVEHYAKNQVVMESRNGTRVFQSYNSVIAKISPTGNVTLDRDTCDYSHTTGKYRNKFLGESKKETRRKIDSGEYTLAKLN